MDQGLVTLIGMSIAYVASFIGLGLAWWAWNRRVADGDGVPDPPSESTPAGGSNRDGGTP